VGVGNAQQLEGLPVTAPKGHDPGWIKKDWLKEVRDYYDNHSVADEIANATLNEEDNDELPG
jgi:hypothetical protein